MKIAIVGSRNYPKLDRVRAYVKSLPSDSIIVSGAARGVDSMAAAAAKQAGLQVIEFPANWSQGRGAGIIRNSLIVQEADRVVAFWDGTSRGTLDTIHKAERARKPVEIIRSDEKHE